MRTRSVGALILTAALIVAGCGSSKELDTAAPSSDNTFVLSEFTIVPPTTSMRAGLVSIRVRNVGTEVHELIIVPSGDDLIRKSNGAVDENKIHEGDTVGKIEHVAPGSQKGVTVELAAGTYVAFCNIVDNVTDRDSRMTNSFHMMQDNTGGSERHAHFGAGMRVTFTVK